MPLTYIMGGARSSGRPWFLASHLYDRLRYNHATTWIITQERSIASLIISVHHGPVHQDYGAGAVPPLYDSNVFERQAAQAIADGRPRDAMAIYLFMGDGDPSLDAGYLAGSYWVPGWCRVCHATRPAISVPSRALPRRRALWTNWKRPR